MVSQIFLGMSLLGAEWVLYFLILLSIVSVALILERFLFYRNARRDLGAFQRALRASLRERRLDEALKITERRLKETEKRPADLETQVAHALLTHHRGNSGKSPEVLAKIGDDALLRTRVAWEKNLAGLATIGSNAPFVGLFGTVLGIIKAFHDLSQQIAMGVQTVTAGIAEALIATAIGILVAIPAVVAFNLFQRRVKSAVAHAEALKSYMIGNLSE